MSTSPERRPQYEQWVRAYAPELYRMAFRLTGRRETAEDLVQETFTEAWRSLSKQREPDKARAWLFQILRFRYAHLIRDTKHDIRAASIDAVAEPATSGQGESPADVMANQEDVQRALNALSSPIKETFLMVFIEERTCREAAEALKIPLGTVLSRLDRARQVIRSVLKDRIAVATDKGETTGP